jgi:hypothetical protein
LVPDKEGERLKQSENKECDEKSAFQIIRVPSEHGRPIVIFKNETVNRVASITQRINPKQFVVLEPMNSSIYQKWRVLRAPRSDAEKTLFNFQNLASNQFLEVEEGGKGKAKMVVVDALHNLGHQSFYLEVFDPEVAKTKAIEKPKPKDSGNANSGTKPNSIDKKELDSTAAGFMVQEINQLRQNLVYCLKSFASGKAIVASKDGQFLTENNSQFCGERSRFQIWIQQKNKGGLRIKLRSLYSGKFVDLDSRNHGPKFVILKNQENSMSQNWWISKIPSSNGGTGSFLLQNFQNRKTLDLLRTQNNWTYLITSDINQNNSNQLFTLQLLGEMAISNGSSQGYPRNGSSQPAKRNDSGYNNRGSL